jgi:hypothetical protein
MHTHSGETEEPEYGNGTSGRRSTPPPFPRHRARPRWIPADPPDDLGEHPGLGGGGRGALGEASQGNSPAGRERTRVPSLKTCCMSERFESRGDVFATPMHFRYPQRAALTGQVKMHSRAATLRVIRVACGAR